MLQAMKTYALLFLIIGMAHGHPNWSRDLTANIHQMTANIQRDIAEMQANLQRELAHINQDVNQRVAQARDEWIKNGSPSIVVDAYGGASRSVISGTAPNGEPYFRDVEERLIGDVLYRTERIYNAKTKEIETHRTTLNTKDPNAKPVVLPDDARPPTPEAPSENNPSTQENKQADSKESKGSEKKAA